MGTGFSKFIRGLICFTLVALMAVGCGAANTTTPASTEKTAIRYQIGWVHEYSTAGFYMAIADGDYAKENLDVSLLVGGFSDSGYIDPVARVVDGEAEFGTTSMFTLLQARAQGKPIVAIASVDQRSPFAIISLAEKDLLAPTDLLGHNVSITDGGARLIYDAFLQSQNIAEDSVITTPRTSFGIEPLTNGEVDALGGWIINEGVALEEAGFQPNFMLMSDYGVDSYESLIFTTEDMIANQPDVVERFLRATIAGHQALIENPEKAIELTLTYDSNLVEEQQLRRLRAFIPLINPAGSKLGMMRPEIWEFNHQLLVDGGILTEPLDLSKAYTLDFLNKIHSV